jgi:hypothetical protein
MIELLKLLTILEFLLQSGTQIPRLMYDMGGNGGSTAEFLRQGRVEGSGYC